jgi:putative transposase
MDELQFFDRKQSYSVAWKTMPHWGQAGTVCFITWRTGDSLPAAAERRITQERAESLRRVCVTPTGNWKAALAEKSPAKFEKVKWEFFAACERELDRGFGECVLRRPELSQIVAAL